MTYIHLPFNPQSPDPGAAALGLNERFKPFALEYIRTHTRWRRSARL